MLIWITLLQHYWIVWVFYQHCQPEHRKHSVWQFNLISINANNCNAYNYFFIFKTVAHVQNLCTIVHVWQLLTMSKLNPCTCPKPSHHCMCVYDGYQLMHALVTDSTVWLHFYWNRRTIIRYVFYAPISNQRFKVLYQMKTYINELKCL